MIRRQSERTTSKDNRIRQALAYGSAESRALYVRERCAPQRGDIDYIHLVDLRDALHDALVGADGLWLDYGSGMSPYQASLEGCRLETADMPQPGRAIDHFIDESGALADVPSGHFDGVLSTQVLEHLPDVGAYLREAYRVMRPGGRLVLTTHGIWEFHPSPRDLRRWTREGLDWEVSSQGFEVRSCVGLTCGRRAALLLFEQQFLATPRCTALRRLLERGADRFLVDERSSSADSARLYVEILLIAERPGHD